MAIEQHPLIVKTLAWADEDQTRVFAQALARKVQAAAPGVAACLEMRGDLGAGKTTLVRHLLQALGVTGRIKSPTYAVVEPYNVNTAAGLLNIWHFDFYRFNDPDEWEEAGFRDIFASPGLKLVEWPEKAGNHLPAPDLALQLELTEGQQRQVTLQAFTPLGAAWAAA